MTGAIRVMIVDDHDMVREALKMALETIDEFQVVASVSSGEDAIRMCSQIHPHVVLMDMVMPGLDGVNATETLRRLFPQIRVIALTSYKSKDLIEGALDAGAISYIIKSITVDELADAIRAASVGQSTFSPEALNALDDSDNPATVVS